MIIEMPHKADIPALRQLWKQAFFDDDGFLDRFFTVGYSPRRCRILRKEGTVASVLYWFDCFLGKEKFSYLYAIATEKSYQRQGLCRALMESTHRHLQSLGYRGAVLVPGEASLFSFYQTLGYRSFCPMTQSTIPAGAEKAVLTHLTGEEFTQRRNKLLPPDGLIQKGETVEFLSSFAEFYSCGETLLCVSKEKDTAHFQEYLGDMAKLPAIVSALGAQTGTVRVTGGTDYAMYYPLDNRCPVPAYLGIALD